MDEDEYDSIYGFLQSLKYPSGYLKHHKRHLRRKCGDYVVDSGVLYHKKESGIIEHLRVPRGVQDKERILHSCHSSQESELQYGVFTILYLRQSFTHLLAALSSVP